MAGWKRERGDSIFKESEEGGGGGGGDTPMYTMEAVRVVEPKSTTCT